MSTRVPPMVFQLIRGRFTRWNSSFDDVDGRGGLPAETFIGTDAQRLHIRVDGVREWSNTLYPWDSWTPIK